MFFAGCFLSHTEAAKSLSTQQFFSVKPHDTEVGQGGTVVLPCEIGDRRGRVQWTKDGLTLGKPSFFLIVYNIVEFVFRRKNLVKLNLKVNRSRNKIVKP